MEVYKNCALFVNDLHSTDICTLIKFHVVEEIKEAGLYFAQDFEVNFDRR